MSIRLKIFALSFVGVFLILPMHFLNIGSAVALYSQERAILTPQTTHSYSYTYGTSYTEASSDWEHIYTGYPAARKGEYDAISCSVSYTHTLSGSLALNIKKEVQVELGYSFGKNMEFSISKTSAPLDVGEYVKAYYAEVYNVTPVYQKDLQHITGWELLAGSAGQYHYVDYYKTEYETAYAKKAIFPQIKMEYYNSSQNASYNSYNIHKNNEIIINDCIKTEIYEYIDGEYKLVYTTGGVIN